MAASHIHHPQGMSSMGVGRRKRVMPLGSSRRYWLEPHGYYDTCSEIFERGENKKERTLTFTRSKTRCTTIAEWMEVCDAATGKAIWRVESRFGDRSVYAPEIAESTSRKGRPAAFITALRMYREYEKEPTLMLVHRDKGPAGITDPSASKEVEVYMCSNLAAHEPDIDPDAELDQFMHDSTSNRPLMPPLDPVKPLDAPTADETFMFLGAHPGDDVFTIQTNSTFTTATLSAIQEQVKGSDMAQGQKRVLANLRRSVTQEPRQIEVDSALDPALVISLFAAVDQLMISHDAIDYDVEWPADYAYTMDQISSCFGPRKPIRKQQTYLSEEDPPNVLPEKPRGCFGF